MTVETTVMSALNDIYPANYGDLARFINHKHSTDQIKSALVRLERKGLVVQGPDKLWRPSAPVELGAADHSILAIYQDKGWVNRFNLSRMTGRTIPSIEKALWDMRAAGLLVLVDGQHQIPEHVEEKLLASAL